MYLYIGLFLKQKKTVEVFGIWWYVTMYVQDSLYNNVTSNGSELHPKEQIAYM